MESAEQKSIENEAARENAEAGREFAEDSRDIAESLREDGEDSRRYAETTRKMAEHARELAEQLRTEVNATYGLIMEHERRFAEQSVMLEALVAIVKERRDPPPAT